MRRKIVKYPHSAQLYDLYQQGRKACSAYWVKIYRLFNDANTTKEVDPLHSENAELFRETFKGMELFCDDWYQSVMDILRQIPRTSLQAKFTADIADADKKISKLYA